MKTSVSAFLAVAALAVAIPAPLFAQNGPPPSYGQGGYGPQGGYGGQGSYGGQGGGYGGQGGYAPQGGGQGQGIPVQQMMEKLRNRLGRLDTNHDNRISLAEWNARSSKKGGQGKDRTRQFNKIDTNHDGYISVSELNAFVQRKVSRMDRNGDGYITPDEKHQKKHGGGQGGGRNRGGDQGDYGDQY